MPVSSSTTTTSKSNSRNPRIFFHFLQAGFAFARRDPAKSFINQLLKKEGRTPDTLRYIFCSDAYLLDINRRYLKHNTYTDIITFDLSEPGQAINAEIYISVDRVRENASQFKTTLRNELHRVMFHGALHLCGYRDKTLKEKELMRKMEDKYLRMYFKSGS